MPSDRLLHVEHLSRTFGEHHAVIDLSFDLERGEILGFLGPNGAGKSTTMQIIAGALAPTRGRIEVAGFDLLERAREAKREIGYLPENPPLYRELTVDEYLRYCGRLHGLKGDTLLEALEFAKLRCGIGDSGRRLIGTLSKGYQQRVGIAQAVLHGPALVILDEPTAGLDPLQVQEIRALIRELGESHSVILSTHILPEVNSLCDRVQIIHRGRLVYSGAVEELNAAEPSELEVAFDPSTGRSNEDPSWLERLPGVDDVERSTSGCYYLSLNGEADTVSALIESARVKGWHIRELTPQHRTLEQIFIDHVHRELGA